jgi:uncharacterized protein DUF5818
MPSILQRLCHALASKQKLLSFCQDFMRRALPILLTSYFLTHTLARRLRFRSQEEKSTLGGNQVMKSLSLLRLLGLLALLISLAGIPLYGQGQQEGSQDPAAQPPTSTSQQSAESQPSQIFVGKVAKSRAGDFLLKGDAGMSYKLDNTDQVEPFLGKSVAITGTLDVTTNTIHITKIEAPSS